MKTHTQFSIKTRAHAELLTITNDVSQGIHELNLEDGIIHIFIKHTTCGLTINEIADPAVPRDILNRLEKLVPWNIAEDRHMEGNSAAHLKSTILGSSLTVPVVSGQLVLGTWQGIFLGEFDGPRTRTVHLIAIRS